MSERPPMKRSEGWLRVFLWLLPSIYAALVYAQRRKIEWPRWADQMVDRDSALLLAGVLLSILVSRFLVFLNTRDSSSGYGKDWREILYSVIWFCMMQTLLVPIALGLVAFGRCFASI